MFKIEENKFFIQDTNTTISKTNMNVSDRKTSCFKCDKMWHFVNGECLNENGIKKLNKKSILSFF